MRRPGRRSPTDRRRGTVAAVALSASLLLLLGAACPPAGPRGGAARPATPPDASPPVPVLAARSPSPGGPLDAAFRERLLGAPADRPREVLLDLVDQVDLDDLRRRFAAAGLDRRQRRAATVAALEEIAARRGALEGWLEERMAGGGVDVWSGYAIVNRLHVSAVPAVILELAGRAEVASIVPVRDDRLAPGPGRPARPPRIGSAPPVPERSWALEAIGAREAWAAGFDGSSVILGSLDTGVFGRHLALRGGRRDGVHWLDPLRGGGEPYDDHGHGTETLGCAVGRGAAPGEIGVAPGASWVAARSNPHNYYNAHGMTAAADWMLRSAGAEVLLCAWGHASGGCDPVDRPLLRALRAAEVIVVFPAGNSGPAEGSGESPGNLAPLFTGDVPPLSVAATARDGGALAESARGPSACDSAVQFPWIAAPGEDVRVASAATEKGFDLASGTSVAAGYVAGAAAVLLQRCPAMTADRVQRILAGTARDLGPPGPDPVFGHGLLDLPAALRDAGAGCR